LTRNLFEITYQFGVQYILSQDCHLAKAKKIKDKIELRLEKCDSIYITIDMDGFHQSMLP